MAIAGAVELARVILVELKRGGSCIRSPAIAGAVELAGMLVVELELGGWSPRSAAIAGAAELTSMLVVELELGGWPQVGGDRRRAELAGMLGGSHQVGGVAHQVVGVRPSERRRGRS